jgi:ribonucleoside-diphosphate reductase alpha chain
LVKKFTHQRFEPSGMTSNRNIPFAKSIVDYIFRWLEQTFLEEGADSRPKSKPAETPGPATKDQAALPKTVSTGSEAVKDDLSSDTRGNQTPRTESRGSIAALLEPAIATATLAAATPRTNRMAQGRADGLDQQFSHFQSDAPPCPGCGSITVRNGNCYKCHNCGSSLGCS